MTSTSAGGRNPAETIGLRATLSSDTASGKEAWKEGKPDEVGAPAEDQKKEKTDPSNFKVFRLDTKHTFGEAGKRRDHTNLISKTGTYTHRGGGKLLVTLTFTWLPPLLSPSLPPLLQI